MTYGIRRRAVFAAALCCAAGVAAASGASRRGTVVVHAQSVTQRYEAYGQVQPVAVANLHAVEAGVVSRLVLPGTRVKAGQVLAVLTGPQAAALRAQRRAVLHAASTQLKADRRKLAARLVTRQTVAADEAAYETARGRLRVALKNLTLRSPAAGEVLAVDVADGEQVAAGRRILALQTGRPWLKATYYGADALAIHPGMTGRFQTSSGPAVRVRVRTVSGALGPDGGEQVGLFPVAVHGRSAAAFARIWRSGRWGTVTLNGATRPMVAVPSRALILDRAHWWVLVRTTHGYHRQRVEPGPSRGWLTFIRQGLEPGEHVVVQNAYLEFYHGIAGRYTPLH